jgi:hypothetical protein
MDRRAAAEGWSFGVWYLEGGVSVREQAVRRIGMALKKIVRAKGGTREREVHIADIVVPDVRSSPLFLPDERWISAVARYYDDLTSLLTAIREDRQLPREFFVPDLWDTSLRLPNEEREMMRDMWGLGHDLARGVGYEDGDPADFIRNGVGGTVYVRP